MICINKRPLTHPDNIKVYRFTRVLFGSKASPSMLNLTVDHHLSRYSTELSELIRRNIYVDNLITGVDGAEEALELYKSGKKMFNDASMNLREWNTNNEEVLSQIPLSDRADTALPSKVLGLKWNVFDDTLFTAVAPIKIPLIVSSKRAAVEAIASVFDPMGIFCPIILNGKLFIQRLWKTKLTWDQTLPQALVNEFTQVAEELHCMTDFRISISSSFARGVSQRNGS